MLTADDIDLTLGDAQLLQGVSLRLEPGTVTVVMGPNGTGKTSLLRVLTGDLLPDGGKVELNNKPVRQWQAEKRARFMAVLPQGSTLNFPFLVEEVVMLGRTPHSTGLARDREIVQEALIAVDGAYLCGRIYTQLSGGEKQRVQLARVLAQIWEAEEEGSQVLMLDEPTASFDLAHQQLMRAMVRNLAVRNIAVLMVLHDLNLAINCADRIVMLSCGRIAASGSPREVITAATIKQIFAVDVDVISHPLKGLPMVIPI